MSVKWRPSINFLQTPKILSTISKELNCDTLLTNQINCIYYKSTYIVCTRMQTHIYIHTHTRIERRSYMYMCLCVCVYYIYCGMCVHCPSSRCWSSPLLLRFWLPRQQNTKYKKKVVFLLSASLFSSRCSLSLWFFGLRSRLFSVWPSPLLPCFVHFYAFALFVISLSVAHTTFAINSRSLARCVLTPPPLLACLLSLSHTQASSRRLHCLSLFIERTTTLPFAPQTLTHIHTPLLSTPSLALFGRFARRYVQFQPPKAENQ